MIKLKILGSILCGWLVGSIVNLEANTKWLKT
jgi:hypothetical protein